MKQLEFESLYGKFWKEFELTLNSIEGNAAEKVEVSDADNKKFENIANFPKDYRLICQHLAIAKSRRYATGLINRLNGLVQQAYLVLYSENVRSHGAFLDFIFFGFPNALRSNAVYLWVSLAIFLIPGILMMVACLVNDQVIYSLMDGGDVRNFESMYDPGSEKFGRERESDTDLLMFGHYISNNIGISFKAFATGIFFGLGSIFIMLFNGLHIGGAAGHITSLGYNETFYPFVIGHGSFELTAIVFSGAAGLKIGFSLLSPGANTRLRSLQLAAADAIKIVYGSTIMLVIAAFIEAFWSSSSTLPIAVKLGVGTLLWVFVIYYCFFFGRENRVQHAIR